MELDAYPSSEIRHQEFLVLEMDIRCDVVPFRLIGQIIDIKLIFELYCICIVRIEKSNF